MDIIGEKRGITCFNSKHIFFKFMHEFRKRNQNYDHGKDLVPQM